MPIETGDDYKIAISADASTSSSFHSDKSNFSLLFKFVNVFIYFKLFSYDVFVVLICVNNSDISA